MLSMRFENATCIPAFHPGTLVTLATLLQIVHVDAEGLEVEINGRTSPLIVDFYATWCANHRTMVVGGSHRTRHRKRVLPGGPAGSHSGRQSGLACLFLPPCLPACPPARLPACLPTRLPLGVCC